MGWPMAMRMARWLGRSHRALGDSGGGGVLGYCAHYVPSWYVMPVLRGHSGQFSWWGVSKTSSSSDSGFGAVARQVSTKPRPAILSRVEA